MAVSVPSGTQIRRETPSLTGTATAYSEAVTATGALDVTIPVSIITILGTATGTADNYTLGTAPYEGMEKTIVTAQSATDGVGVANIELANAVGDPASQNITMEFPASIMCKWLNDRWVCFGALTQGVAAALTTATV